MDETDKKILELLQDNSRISISDISRSVNLSRPSVNYRIDKLFDEGIIEKFISKVQPLKIGYEIVFYVLVSDIKIQNERFRTMLEECDNYILEVQCVTGKANYIIKAATPNVKEMNEFLSNLRQYAQIESMMTLHTIVEDRKLKILK